MKVHTDALLNASVPTLIRSRLANFWLVLRVSRCMLDIIDAKADIIIPIRAIPTKTWISDSPR